MDIEVRAPKAPRWITTEAGRRAWEEYDAWRTRAASALSVQDRSQLLAEAEQLVLLTNVASA
jgi:hypothetical protein